MTGSDALLLGCLFVAALSTPASADDLRLVGKFAFPTDANLDKVSCARINRAMALRLASTPYRCESTPVSSGKGVLSCSRPDGRGYLVFGTKAACESERKDEAVAE